MSDFSLRLTFRYGSEIESPSLADMRAALAEVFHENHPDLTEGDYVEHPNSWLEYGFQNGDDWTVITVDVYRTGLALYSHLADQDDDEPRADHRLQNVTEDRALELFQLLANRDIDNLATVFQRP